MLERRFGLSDFQYNIFLPICLIISGVLMVASIDIYLPAAPYLKRHFETTEWLIQLSMMQTPIVASLVGLFYGHWSDIEGRRKALLYSNALFAAGSFLCCFAWDIESFLAFRFFQAIGAGGISVISISILADMFSGPTYARYMATYSMGFPIMFALAPVIGAYLLKWFGWHANFWFLGVISSILWLIFYKSMPETNQKHTETLKWNHLGSNIKKLLKKKHFLILAFAHGLPVAISAVYSVNSSFIFIDHFKFSPTSYAYIQLIPVMINLIGSIIYRHQVLNWGVSKSIKFGIYLCAAFLTLTILGVMLDVLQIPVSIVLIMCVLNLSLSTIIASTGTRAIEYAPKLKGLAVAFLGLLRNGVVAILVLVVGAFFNGTIIPVYIGMAILTSVLIFLLWPYSKEVPPLPEI
ncbi:MAG: MFS transporter [Alphaproteobacteria bacterium]